MGAQLRVYRQKIRSAQTTKKITRAMELIAASRIQKAKARVEASDPYTRALTRAVSAVANYSNIDHPLITEAESVTRAAVVIFTSDRGLAGAFNSQVLREAELVTVREEGQHRFYSLNPEPLEIIEDYVIPFLSADFETEVSVEYLDADGEVLPDGLHDAAEKVGRVAAVAQSQVKQLVARFKFPS